MSSVLAHRSVDSSRRGIRRPLSAIQAFAVTALLMSTTIHWAVVVLQRFGSLLIHPNMGDATFWAGFVVEQCVGTATLTINVRHTSPTTFLWHLRNVTSCTSVGQIILSDLAVWWRVWVLWPESRVVYGSGCLLLFATFGKPVRPHTSHRCAHTHLRSSNVGHRYNFVMSSSARVHVRALGRRHRRSRSLPRVQLYRHRPYRVQGLVRLDVFRDCTMFNGQPCRLYHKSIRSRSESGSANTRVEHILVLLVECGALYCVLWVRARSIAFILLANLALAFLI